MHCIYPLHHTYSLFSITLTAIADSSPVKKSHNLSISLHNCSFNTSICNVVELEQEFRSPLTFPRSVLAQQTRKIDILLYCLACAVRPSWSYWRTGNFSGDLALRRSFQESENGRLKDNNVFSVCEWPREEGLVALLSRFDSQSPSGLQVDHFFSTSQSKTNRWVIAHPLTPLITLFHFDDNALHPRSRSVRPFIVIIWSLTTAEDGRRPETPTVDQTENPNGSIYF